MFANEITFAQFEICPALEMWDRLCNNLNKRLLLMLHKCMVCDKMWSFILILLYILHLTLGSACPQGQKCSSLSVNSSVWIHYNLPRQFLHKGWFWKWMRNFSILGYKCFSSSSFFDPKFHIQLSSLHQTLNMFWFSLSCFLFSCTCMISTKPAKKLSFIWFFFYILSQINCLFCSINFTIHMHYFVLVCYPTF